MAMRIFGVLAIVASVCVGHPALGYADAAMPPAETVADVFGVFDWMLLYLRIKVLLVLLIMGAISALAHLAQRAQHSGRDGELAAVRIG
jgi:hypothetical protein